MARWKLSRLKFGEDELLLNDGEEKTIGRAAESNLAISSLVISRNHCVVKAEKGKLSVTDLKSSNGVYVGINKIPSSIPYELNEGDIMGLGWTEGIVAQIVNNNEKYMFEVIKIPTLPDRIKFELDSELEVIKKERDDLHDQPSTSNHVARASASVLNENKPINNNSESVNLKINDSKPSSSKVSSPIIETKRNLKRKSDEPLNSHDHNNEGQPSLRRSRNQISYEDDDSRSPTSHEKGQPALRNEGQPDLKRSRNLISFQAEDDVISISDSDTEMPVQRNIKKPVLETVPEKPETPIKEEVKTEKEDIDLEYFNIKREYLGYDDEAIQIDSDSDSESEQWFMRLSQSSPGKPFLKIKRDIEIPEETSKNYPKLPKECSYSQIEDFVDLNDESDEDYEHDMISIPPEPPNENREITLPHVNMSNVQEIKNEVHDQNNSKSVTNTACNGLQQPTSKEVLRETDQEIELDEYLDDLISLVRQDEEEVDTALSKKIYEKQVPKELPQIVDVVDGLGRQQSPKHGKIVEPSSSLSVLHSSNDAPELDKVKRAQMIKPLKSPTKKASTSSVTKSKHKGKSSSSRKKSDHSSAKKHISNSQKEERKKKLKDIATKEIEEKSKASAIASKDKAATAIVKVTSSNRGAFLSDIVEVVKPMKKISPLKSAKGKKSEETTSKQKKDTTVALRKEDETSQTISKDKPRRDKSSTSSNNKTIPTQDTDSKKKHSSESDKPKSKHKSDKKNKRHSIDTDSDKANLENQRNLIVEESSKGKSIESESPKSLPEIRIPLKSLKPLSCIGSEVESLSGKPISKVGPFPTKKVRFSEAPPKVYTFFIEEGNKMKRTSLAKSSLVDIRQRPTFSLEKLALIKILRWNPHWLVEQMNFKDPPPILGTSVPPVSVYHSFDNHHQYHAIFGDLILMEIWEGLTQRHLKARGSGELQMRIAHVPPVPAPDRNFELFSLSVNVSVPNSESKSLPRHGEILNVTFGPENARTTRFFYVHNVRFLPSPAKNINTFCVISLHACYTDKMKTLKQGELMVAINLGFIQKELQLFEAIDNLSGSPLLDAILRPHPMHFQKNNINVAEFQSNFTEELNESQLRAVAVSVTAALGDRPCINMVQGPPGTGKSAVISAIVMSYFNDANRKRYHNRGKILICATSNAAVDELVLRLLKIRHKLEREDRFKLVRVGRTEAMHKKALDVSSQLLAKRDAAARQNAEPARPGLNEEISHLEAKINMWNTQALDSKDQVRIAYCQQKIQQTVDRITLLRNAGGGGGSEELRGEQLVAAERRIIDGADIVVTTLASAQNNKLRGLKRRIALCIIDEAGQAIEPETLIPLTLDVTKITLVGDPQQLPGYICSQRAKKHGLGESLFSRITSGIELWPAGSMNPVVLLNRQYRMHPDIVDYPNRAFYNNLIHNEVQQPRPNINVMPYLILSISSGDKGQGSCGGNEMESWGVARLVASLYTVLNNTLSLAVITPYNAHKELIKRNLKVLQNPNDCPIEVNTVDSFQGQERDVVVVSLARSQGVGFLTDAGRMNVMLTRAKHALIVCLNQHAMIKNLQWRTLVEDAQRRNLFRTLPNRLCVGPSGGVDRDEILQYVAFQRPPPR